MDTKQTKGFTQNTKPQDYIEFSVLFYDGTLRAKPLIERYTCLTKEEAITMVTFERPERDVVYVGTHETYQESYLKYRESL